MTKFLFKKTALKILNMKILKILKILNEQFFGCKVIFWVISYIRHQAELECWYFIDCETIIGLWKHAYHFRTTSWRYLCAIFLKLFQNTLIPILVLQLVGYLGVIKPNNTNKSLREKCPNTEIFLVRIWTFFMQWILQR